jgi:hypothetical protein
VNGDGVPDLIQCDDDSESGDPSQAAWTAHLWQPANGSTAAGFNPTAETIGPLAMYACNTELYTADVNGDGKVDLVVGGGPAGQQPFGTYSWLTRIDNMTWSSLDTQLPVVLPGGHVLFLDVNGDGLPDAVESGFPDHVLRTYFNTGPTFAAVPLNALPPDPLGNPQDTYFNLATPLDFNGDGRQDLLIPVPGGTLPNESDTLPAWAILQAQEAGSNGPTFTLVDPQIPFDALLNDSTITLADPHGPRIGDLNGDGAPDVVLPLSGVFNVFQNLAPDQDTLAGTADFYDNETVQNLGTVVAFPFAGQVAHEWRWLPGLSTQPNPTQIELAFTDVTPTFVPTNGGATYFTLPTTREVRREEGTYPSGTAPTVETYVQQIETSNAATVLRDTTSTVSNFDTFGNVLAEDIATVGVDLTLNATRTFKNDTTAWILGQLQTQTECSTAAMLSQCRTLTRQTTPFGETQSKSSSTDDGLPDTQLTVVGDGGDDRLRHRRGVGAHGDLLRGVVVGPPPRPRYEGAEHWPAISRSRPGAGGVAALAPLVAGPAGIVGRPPVVRQDVVDVDPPHGAVGREADAIPQPVVMEAAHRSERGVDHFGVRSLSMRGAALGGVGARLGLIQARPQHDAGTHHRLRLGGSGEAREETPDGAALVGRKGLVRLTRGERLDGALVAGVEVPELPEGEGPARVVAVGEVADDAGLDDVVGLVVVEPGLDHVEGPAGAIGAGDDKVAVAVVEHRGVATGAPDEGRHRVGGDEPSHHLIGRAEHRVRRVGLRRVVGVPGEPAHAPRRRAGHAPRLPALTQLRGSGPRLLFGEPLAPCLTGREEPAQGERGARARPSWSRHRVSRRVMIRR